MIDDGATDSMQHLAALYQQHARSASRVQRIADRVTAALARPTTLSIVVALVMLWIGGNYVAHWFGSPALEAFPFPDLAFIATVAAFLVALLILTTQRHEDALAEKRAQLTLQIAVISERKIAKVIALLEEQRRDNPLLHPRVDAEAERMAQATDAVVALVEPTALAIDGDDPAH